MKNFKLLRLTSARQSYFWYLSVAISALFSFSHSEAGCSRKLDTKILCPTEDTDYNCTTSAGEIINLIHTTANGSHDIIHYVFTTWGTPSVLVGRTSHNAALTVNFKKLLQNNVTETKNSIHFTNRKDIHQLFVVTLSEVIDFVNTDDSAKVENKTKMVVHDLSGFNWQNVSVKQEEQGHYIVFNTSRNPENPLLSENGSIIITFRALCDEGYFSELPNLQYNSNMSLADVVLDNLTTAFNNSRLAVTLSVAVNESNPDKMMIDKHQSVDDEHSPGSFVTLNWLTSPNNVSSGAFLQWKPTCYRQPVRNLQSLSTSSYTDPLVYEYNHENITRSLAYNYFGDFLLDNIVNVSYSRISFGLPGDGFYASTKYDVWSFSFGFGTPPSDKISIAIIFVIAIGLGIPIVLIIGGAIYMCIRKYKHRDGYEEITGSYSEIN